MKIKLNYGQNGLEVDLPSDNVTLIMNEPLKGLENEQASFVQSLDSPIQSKPLKELISPTDKIAIVIPDITRPFPFEKILTWLFDYLSEIPSQNFVIINGTGTHRANTDQELIQMVGKKIFNQYRIINHLCQDDSTMSLVGKAPEGHDVYFNSDYVNADKRLVLGFIEPHIVAGFSGGYKGVFPGIADLNSIGQYHRPVILADPNSKYGEMTHNPTQNILQHNGALVPVTFLINLTLNHNREITNYFCGDCLTAHLQGCDFVKNHCMFKCEHSFPIVITTNNGYPLDQNLYQCAKGLYAAKMIVKQNGLIITAAQCNDGFGNNTFKELLFSHDSPESLMKTLYEREKIECGQWVGQHFGIVHEKARVALYSDIDAQQASKAYFEPISDIAQRVQQELEHVGKDSPIAVLPEGFMTIPYIAN